MENEEVNNEQENVEVLNSEEGNEGNASAEAESGSDEGNNEAEAAQFDPEAFSRRDGDVKTEENEEVKNEEGDRADNDSDSEGDDDGFVWPDLSDSDDVKKDEGEGEEIKSEDNAKGEQNNESAVDLDDTHYKQFAKDLGLEADNLDEIKNSIDDIIKENLKLKEDIKYSGNTNKKIENLENFLKLDDENLMRKSLEADGLKGDKLENVLDKYTDTGLLEVEALKVRNNIDKAVQSERQSISKSDEADVARQQESRTESVKSFTEYMQSQESLFGFKLTGDSEKLPKIRENHVKYVTSGDYLSEITSNEQNLAESSWLWKNRAVLQKAMSNNGRQNGRAEILNKIGNPSKTSSSTFTEPGNSKEFDPKKFMNG